LTDAPRSQTAASESETAARLSQELEAVFAAVERERMREVPILNPKLRVACIGMRAYNGLWVSILVTPWFINVMLLPGSEAEAKAWSTIHLGTKVQHQFPAGAFEFLCGAEPELGPYRMCSLFSPVLQFEDQDAALAAAEGAIGALFEAEKPPAPEKKEAPQLSRRTLFFGRKDEGRR
jgi:[NiFe] hydrogenase assembly HybE family chaperone